LHEEEVSDLELAMFFDIIGDVSPDGTLAIGGPMRELHRLKRCYGPGLWKKCKGTARVRLPDGTVRRAEVHWYEVHRDGAKAHEPKEFKIKRFVDSLQ
jgi:hypothetical protein